MVDGGSASAVSSALVGGPPSEEEVRHEFRLLLGTALLLFGAAILRARVVAGWLGWVAILGGLFSVVIGVDVGYSGLASGLQDALGIAFLVVVVAFAAGRASGTRPQPERVAARS